MSDSKYIVVKNANKEERMIIFSDLTNHDDMYSLFLNFELISAGFISIDEGEAEAYGKSFTLQIGSRRKADTALANQTLGLGDWVYR